MTSSCGEVSTRSGLSQFDHRRPNKICRRFTEENGYVFNKDINGLKATNDFCLMSHIKVGARTVDRISTPVKTNNGRKRSELVGNVVNATTAL